MSTWRSALRRVLRKETVAEMRSNHLNVWQSLLLAVSIGVAIFASAPVVAADRQADALALQQKAVKRLNDFIEEYRRTLDLTPLTAELTRADAELAQSNQMLREQGDDADLALGLIKQGSVWRVQDQHARAIAHYVEAFAAASRVGHLVHQANAL